MSDIAQLFELSRLRRYGRICIRVAHWLIRLLSASIEIYLRRNFGRRYLPMLFGAVGSFLLCAWFASPGAPCASVYLAGMFIMIIRHCVFALLRRGLPTVEPHTLSTGESWSIWHHWRFQDTTVQRYLEPALTFIVGLLVFKLDPFLGFWLAASALALFIKEQLDRVSAIRHILDAADGRIEAQRLSGGLNRNSHQSSRAAQQPHRARLPGHTGVGHP